MVKRIDVREQNWWYIYIHVHMHMGCSQKRWLQHVAMCIEPTHRFMSRIFPAQGPYTGKTDVSDEVHSDVKWFIEFARHFNGIVLIKRDPKPVWEIERFVPHSQWRVFTTALLVLLLHIPSRDHLGPHQHRPPRGDELHRHTAPSSTPLSLILITPRASRFSCT